MPVLSSLPSLPPSYLLPLGECADEAEHAHAGLRAAVREADHLHRGDGVDYLGGREGGRERGRGGEEGGREEKEEGGREEKEEGGREGTREGRGGGREGGKKGGREVSVCRPPSHW